MSWTGYFIAEDENLLQLSFEPFVLLVSETKAIDRQIASVGVMIKTLEVKQSSVERALLSR